MNIFTELLILSIPLIWELINDRDGDSHKTRGILEKLNISSKTSDVYARGILMIVCSLAIMHVTGRHFAICLGMSLSIFLMFFDYLIAYILIKRGIINGHWFTYLGENDLDENVKNIPPMLRFTIKLVMFTTFLILYIKTN